MGSRNAENRGRSTFTLAIDRLEILQVFAPDSCTGHQTLSSAHGQHISLAHIYQGGMTEARKDAPLELLPHALPPVFAADALAISADVGREFGRRPTQLFVPDCSYDWLGAMPSQSDSNLALPYATGTGDTVHSGATEQQTGP